MEDKTYWRADTTFVHCTYPWSRIALLQKHEENKSNSSYLADLSEHKTHAIRSLSIPLLFVAACRRKYQFLDYTQQQWPRNSNQSKFPHFPKLRKSCLVWSSSRLVATPPTRSFDNAADSLIPLCLSASARLVARVVRYHRVTSALVTQLSWRQVVRVLDVVHHRYRVQRLHRDFPLGVLVTGEVRLRQPVRAVWYREDFPSGLVGRVAGDLGPTLVADGTALAVVHANDVRLLRDWRGLFWRPVRL